jgi:DNA processing protein
VVEAGERSGALITAYMSLDQNREVFAVPGSIYSSVSKGPNKLIRDGARLIESTDDVIEALDLKALKQHIEAKKIIPDTLEEKIILEQLDGVGIHINELNRLTNLTSSVINSTLVLMEMKGMVKNVGGM